MTVTPPEGEKAARKKTKHLTPAEWAKARELWALGDGSYDSLAKKFGVSKVAIFKHMEKHKVKHGSKSAAALSSAAAEAAAKEIEEVHARAKKTKDEFYQWQRYISRATVKELVDAEKAGISISSVGHTIKTYGEAMRTLVNGQNVAWRSLGLDVDQHMGDTLPELIIRQMSDTEAEKIRSVATEEDELLGISDEGEPPLDDPEADGETEDDEDTDEEPEDKSDARPGD